MAGSIPSEACDVGGESRACGSRLPITSYGLTGQKLLETHLQSWDTRELCQHNADTQEPACPIIPISIFSWDFRYHYHSFCWLAGGALTTALSGDGSSHSKSHEGGCWQRHGHITP